MRATAPESVPATTQPGDHREPMSPWVSPSLSKVVRQAHPALSQGPSSNSREGASRAVVSLMHWVSAPTKADPCAPTVSVMTNGTLSRTNCRTGGPVGVTAADPAARSPGQHAIRRGDPVGLARPASPARRTGHRALGIIPNIDRIQIDAGAARRPIQRGAGDVPHRREKQVRLLLVLRQGRQECHHGGILGHAICECFIQRRVAVGFVAREAPIPCGQPVSHATSSPGH